MTPINDQDLELLSAYLDDELGASQRAALDMRLTTDPALAATLEELRQTVKILRAAPPIKVPRNFTLDPARYKRPTPWWMRYGAMQLVGAVGAAASVLIIAGGVYLSGLNMAAAPASAGANSVAALPSATNGLLLAQDATELTASPSPLATYYSTNAAPTDNARAFAAKTDGSADNEVQSTTVQESSAETQTEEFLLTKTTDNAAIPEPAPMVPGGMTDNIDSASIPSASGLANPSTGSGGSPYDVGNGQNNGQAAGSSVNPPILVATVAETPTVIPEMPTSTGALAKVDVNQATQDTAVAMQQVPTNADGQYAQDASHAQANKDQASESGTRDTQASTPFSGGQVAVIIGVALLVLSVMLFLLGLLRARQKPTL